VDLVGAGAWIRDHVEPFGGIETEHERPWATVLRVPLAGGVAWFKACAPVQAFEPRLTGDPWFARLRDAYLEPWSHGLDGVFALAMRVGAFAHAIAWMRQRDHLSAMERTEFDRGFPIVLRRAIVQTL
jgi:hypothetical protein